MSICNCRKKHASTNANHKKIYILIRYGLSFYSYNSIAAERILNIEISGIKLFVRRFANTYQNFQKGHQLSAVKD